MTALPDFTPLQGGVPIVHEGHVVGAIGAKSAAQDEEVAKAGAAVIKEKSWRAGANQNQFRALGRHGCGALFGLLRLVEVPSLHAGLSRL